MAAGPAAGGGAGGGTPPPSPERGGEGRGATRDPAGTGSPGITGTQHGMGGPPVTEGSRLALAVPGDGRGGVPPEYDAYLARFRQRIQDSLLYPLAARRRGLSGKVELDVLIDPRGRVEDVEVVSSSSHAQLDEAAVETVRQLGPLPFPAGLPARPLKVRLPLVFELR